MPTPTSARKKLLSLSAMALAAACVAASPGAVAGDDDRRRPDTPQLHSARNPSGVAATISTNGFIDLRNPFFQPLGSNGRSCLSCHQPAEGWSITPRGLRERFDDTRGHDPVFRLVDGANSPRADVSTLQARERSYSMLLRKGLIRVGLPIPPGAQFELVSADDPYGYASAAELSLFRRPLATTNLRFLSTVMWDGRETFKDVHASDCLFNTATCFATPHFDLEHQSNSAVASHAQGAVPLSADQRNAIVDFALGLHTAQVRDDAAGLLTAHGARGGPSLLPGQLTYFGINDTLAGDYRTRAPFSPSVMSVYTGWLAYAADDRRAEHEDRDHDVAEARRAVARGEQLFNAKPIAITGVKGLNDDLAMATIPGTCTTCHNTPNAGNHSVPLPLDIGLTDASRRTPDLPLYTLRNLATGVTLQTSDPGRALVTGLWKDIGRFKGPTLRALAPRAPYFHNGFAASLDEVVAFYNTRFGIGFTVQEQRDLVAFLKAL